MTSGLFIHKEIQSTSGTCYYVHTNLLLINSPVIESMETEGPQDEYTEEDGTHENAEDDLLFDGLDVDEESVYDDY